MQMLKLAIQAKLPLIYVRTDDVINVEEVLNFVSGGEFNSLSLPEHIDKVSSLKDVEGSLFYTSSPCKSLKKLYIWALNSEKTIVFVNSEKSVLQFDCGTLVPPKELVQEFLVTISDEAEALLPSFGGMTLKDVAEVSKLTMTRDNSLTIRGVNETRRGYRNLKGITAVDTNISYYVCPEPLQKWIDNSADFFMNPVHESLTPRGLLLDGPPGTGKTLAPKHIAATLGIPLYHLDIGALKGKYVGESEGNFLAALDQADEVEPCVILIDEVEKIFQTQGDSGVTNSLLSQFLWWLQEHKSRVLTVMTTNDISIIPAELYREGRVDETMEFLGIKNAKEGVSFAFGAATSICQEIGYDAGFMGEAENLELIKRIKCLYAEVSGPVPQARLTKTTYSYIKELIGEKK